MNKKLNFYGLFLLVVLAALLFRLLNLDVRPMHHDEANQAVKFGNLLEKGEYRYDKTEHHGPSLYYCTLPFAWVLSGASFASVNETTLRLVPVVFGVGIILLFLLFKGGYSPESMFFAGIFAAISPAMVFYSRFYIQEMLLVFFTVGAIAACWRYTQNRTLGWAAAIGLFCGMMYATKETSIIIFGALLAALVFSPLSLRATSRTEKKHGRLTFSHLLVFLAAAVLVFSLLYSSFFRNARGILDSMLAFLNYFDRAGEPGFHSHPWYYYLKILSFSRSGTGPIWSEALILGLALVGCVAAFLPHSRKDTNPLFIRLVLFYTILATAVYSLIPYKTPWNMLPFYIGFILLAGNGAAFMVRVSRKLLLQGLLILALGAGVCQLGLQCYRANFKLYTDPRNPYVYAQTSPDFMNLVKRINDLARYHPDQTKMLIKVITHPDEAWPLPWYLRAFSRVGYWQEVDEAGELSNVPLIISSVDTLDKLQHRLQGNFQSEYYGLRPGVLLALHIKKDLWNAFLQHRTLK